MKTRDLGILHGEVLLFGGAYSNAQATRAVLDVAVARAIAASNMICTGDLVAYCADAGQTVALIRESNCPIVAGNCERQLAGHASDCGCGFGQGTACDVLSAGWFAHADGKIGQNDRVWMAALPDLISFYHRGKRHVVIHGGMTNISRFIWPSSPQEVFDAEVAAIRERVADVDVVVAGHSGIAFQRRVAGVDWINAGAIGMPPHDGRRKTRFVSLRPDGVFIERLDYDAKGARDAMLAVGLTQGYHDTLISGVWPSQEVLPQEMRR